MKLARLCMCLVVALALSLATGCGDDDGGSDGGSDQDAITAAIETFAGGGPDACDVLTDEYVEELAGGREECDKQSGETQDLDVEVENVQVDGDTATAEATAEGETANIELEKDGDDWKISNAAGAE